MSREIDMENLSKEDIRYLQDRGKRPTGAEPVPVDRPEPTPLEATPNTGDVGLPADQSEGMTAEGKAVGVDIEDNYDDLDTDALKDELRERELTVSGGKSALIDRLRQDDQRRAAAGEL